MNLQLKHAAKLRGEARTAMVAIKIREAMQTIQREIDNNCGIYPGNGGAVSMNEVARRAKISETTLFSPKQKELGRIVKAWVESLKERKLVGRMRVRRTVHERANQWRTKFLDLQHAFVGTELELQDAKALLEETRDELSELRAENSNLVLQLSELGHSKVRSIIRKDS